MLTIKQILAVTPKLVITGAGYVRVGSIEKKVSKQGDPIVRGVARCQYDLHGVKKKTVEAHKCSVKGLMGKGTKVHEKYVEVSCDCGFFWSHSEVALHKKGAAQIIHSNGANPVEKNPSMKPYPCKHLHRLLNLVLTRKL